jgi:hypothetical protein
LGSIPVASEMLEGGCYGSFLGATSAGLYLFGYAGFLVGIAAASAIMFLLRWRE